MKKSEGFQKEFNALKPLVVQRAGGKVCEAKIPEAHNKGLRIWHFHHKLRRSHGGPNTLENVVLLCDGCHEYIHRNPSWSFDNGWLIRGVK